MQHVQKSNPIIGEPSNFSTSNLKLQTSNVTRARRANGTERQRSKMSNE